MKNFLYWVFVLVVPYTVYGAFRLATLSDHGNENIAIVFFFPIMLLQFIFQTLMYRKRNSVLGAGIVFLVLNTSVLFILWTYIGYLFMLDFPEDTLLYMGPYAVLSVVTFGLFFKARLSGERIAE